MSGFSTQLEFDDSGNLHLVVDGDTVGSWEPFNPVTLIDEGDMEKLKMLVECAYAEGQRRAAMTNLPPGTTVRDLMANLNEEMILWDGLDDAIVSYTEGEDGFVAVYSYNKCVEIFTKRDGMTDEEAREWVDFNITGCHPGKCAPLMVWEV